MHDSPPTVDFHHIEIIDVFPLLILQAQFNRRQMVVYIDIVELRLLMQFGVDLCGIIKCAIFRTVNDP